MNEQEFREFWNAVNEDFDYLDQRNMTEEEIDEWLDFNLNKGENND